MIVAMRMALTFALLLADAWACLPGGFGLGNFRKSHRGFVGRLATLCGWLLLLVHPLAMGMIWYGGGLAVWLLLVAVMHVVFFGAFGSNVSTR